MISAMQTYLEELNAEQKSAALKIDGPLLILAGAGAGKTKTLTHRILHLIHTGVTPHNILAITFTNKAAKEMRERVVNLIKEDKTLNLPVEFNEYPFVSTFHSLGVHILKQQAHHLDLPRHFTIFDRDDSKKAVRAAVKKLDLDVKEFEPNKVLSLISRQKGNMNPISKFRETGRTSYFADNVGAIWNEYEKTLKDEKALDFDDLILKTALLLRDNAEVREYYQSIWSHIHIDEYQDTNKVQYEIATQLAGKNQNICVVGDIDQNIYSWRGADLKNILNFEKDYPTAETITLERNYRSTQTILTVANRIIEKNVHRKDKRLYTENNEGDLLHLYEAYNEGDEARHVALKAKEMIRSGIPAEEIAVLYRTNFQSRALEDACIKNDVPYQLLGVRFFERKEVKDVLSYIRAALNPDSATDIKRVINSPKRGIGKTTVLRIFGGEKDKLSKGAAEKVNNFYRILREIGEFSKVNPPSETVKFVIRESGMEAALKDGTDEDRERLFNAQELATIATSYDHMGPEEGLEQLLTQSALQSDQDELDSEKKQAGIKMMTIHASKGLEFDFVFITGLEDGLFPSDRSHKKKDSEEGEEERRLFYVALTRARKRIFLAYTQIRTIFGTQQVNTPSEFLIDIDDELIERDAPTEKSFNSGKKRGYLDDWDEPTVLW